MFQWFKAKYVSFIGREFNRLSKEINASSVWDLPINWGNRFEVKLFSDAMAAITYAPSKEAYIIKSLMEILAEYRTERDKNGGFDVDGVIFQRVLDANNERNSDAVQALYISNPMIGVYTNPTEQRIYDEAVGKILIKESRAKREKDAVVAQELRDAIRRGDHELIKTLLGGPVVENTLKND